MMKWWTTEEDRQMEAMARQGYSVEEIAARLGRTEHAIRTRCSNNGVGLTAYGREPSKFLHEDYAPQLYDDSALATLPRPRSVPDHLDRGTPCRIWQAGL